jgi:PleD family two-component response regulator
MSRSNFCSPAERKPLPFRLINDPARPLLDSAEGIRCYKFNMFVSVEHKLEPIENSACTILLVEDNESLANAMAGLLRLYGFKVLQARNAAEAFEASACFDKEIHFLLIDAVLPQVSGIDLAGLLLTQRPEIQLIFMSG